MKLIKENLKKGSDRHKSLVKVKRTLKEFSVGDKVFLKVKVDKITIKSSKLFATYMGPFTILQKINHVAY